MIRLSPSRRWWLALLALLIFACVLRLTGYNFSLPYMDHTDEVDFYWTGQEWRGVFSFQNYLQGYPPLYIWLNIVVQLIAEAFGIRGLSATVQILRLLSIAISLATLLMIVITARLGGGWFAGIAAGTAWAIAPLIVENAVYATPDPLVYLLVSAAVCFAVIALIDPRRQHWSVWSVVAGCLAILTKYFVLTAVLPGILVALLIYRKDHRRGWRYLGLQALLLVVTAAVTLPGIAVLGREGAGARTTGLANILDPSRVLNNIFQAFQPLNAPFFLIMLVLAAACWIVRRSQRVRGDVVALSLLILISVPWLAATFSLVTPQNRMKDVLPATTAACVLLGLAMTQVLRLLPRLTRPFLLLIPLILVVPPQLSSDAALMRDRVRPDSRVVLRQWADVNLAPGTVLVGSENQNTFNPYWGGLQGQHWFDWIFAADFTAKSPQAWQREDGIQYVIYDRSIWQGIQATAEGQNYLELDAPSAEHFSAGGSRAAGRRLSALADGTCCSGTFWRFYRSTGLRSGK